MRNYILLVVSFLALSSSTFAGNFVFRYRVQCATSLDKDLTSKINNIPDQMKFIMPNGGVIYFSGDYYNQYEDAKKRLDEVVALGFKDAFIRVFKTQNILSKPVGDKYISKLEKYRVAEAKRKKEQELYTLNQPKKNPVKKMKTYSKAEMDARQKAKSKAKEEVIVEVVDTVAKKEKPVEEFVKSTMVDEAPIFKIQLASTNVYDETPAIVNDLTSEVVYSYTKGKKKVYAVGFFESAREAKKVIGNYNRYSVQPPFVVGVYKGKVISERLAIELYNEFHNLNTTTK